MSEMWSKIFFGLNVKYRNFSDFNETWVLSKDFRKILKYQISWKPSVGTELFNADRQTGMAKLIVAFRNFAYSPKKTMNADDGNRDDVLQCACASLPILFSICSWLWRHSKSSYLYVKSQSVHIEGRTAFSRRDWVSCYVTREHGSMLAPPYVTLPCVITGLCGLPNIHPCSITKCFKIVILRKLISEKEQRRWHNAWNPKKMKCFNISYSLGSFFINIWLYSCLTL